jgi:cytochrome b
LALVFKKAEADAPYMGTLVVLAILVTLAVLGGTGWLVADSRDGKDWKPMDWPTGRRNGSAK